MKKRKTKKEREKYDKEKKEMEERKRKMEKKKRLIDFNVSPTPLYEQDTTQG